MTSSTIRRFFRSGLALCLAGSSLSATSATWQRDASFNPVFEYPAPNSGVISPTALPDGSVLLSTSYSLIDARPVSGLTHLKADGTLDAAFQVAVPARVTPLAIYPDGRILVITPSLGYPEPSIIQRLLPSGAPDSSFHSTVLLSASFPQARLQSDGKILVFGSFASVDGVACAQIARLDADGSLDPTFASPFSYSGGPTVNDACAQADGKIVLTGGFSLNSGAVGIVRLLPSGSIDAGFTSSATPSFAAYVTVLSSGQLLVTADRTVRRLNADGTIDSSYAPNFLQTVVSLGRPLANGRVYFVDNSISNTTNSTLHRLNADGSLDRVFSYTTPYSAPYGVGLPDTWDESAFYLGSALTADRNNRRQELSRLDASGALVASFAPRFSRDDSIEVVGRSTDGSYWIKSSTDYVNGIARPAAPGADIRLKADGTVDAGFTPPTGLSDILFEPDGHFVARGDFTGGNHFARFAADGTELARYPITPGALISDDGTGRLYSLTGDHTLARYLADGSLDAPYSPSITNSIRQFVPRADGKLYLWLSPAVGSYEPPKIVRLLSTGAIDPSFDLSPYGYYNGGRLVLVALPDGGLLLIELNGLGLYGAMLHFERYDASGTKLFAYTGAKDVWNLAGVILDSLASGGVSGSVALKVSATLSGSPLLPNWLQVRSDGELTMTLGSYFDGRGALVRYRRDPSSTNLNLAATIAASPAKVQSATGGSASFTTTAFGAEPIAYQWLKDGQPLSRTGSDTTGPFLFLNNVQPADIGGYSVRVTNLYGSATSTAADLTMDSAPVFLSQPASRTVRSGESTAFTVSTTQTPVATYQWQAQASGSSTWSDLADNSTYSGTNATTLSLAQTTLAMNGTAFRCTARNAVGSATSDSATLTVTSVAVPATLTWAQPAPIAFGTALSATQLAATANTTGTFIYSPAAGTLLGRGTHTLTVTFSPTDPNFTSATAQVSLTVVPADYSGTYFGPFASGGGSWALQVKADGSATYLAWLPDRQSAVLVHLTVGPDGQFSAAGSEVTRLDAERAALAVSTPRPGVRAAASFTLSGTIAREQVSGNLDGLAHAFSGARDSATGSAPAGFYASTALGFDTGSVYAIVAPSGQTLAVTASPALIDGVLAALSPAGRLDATGTAGSQVALAIAASAHTLSATVTPPGGAPLTFAGLADGTPSTARLVNISARAYCGVGNNVTIGGFVIAGTGSKRVLVRAVGPTLTTQGLSPAEVLADPLIEVHRGPAIIATNDNWGANANAAEIVSLGSQIGAAALAAADTTSSALLLDLQAGVYSFVVSGKAGATGIVLLEIYDADSANPTAQFVNISTRAFCTTGNGVAIGGFVIAGNSPKRVLLRGLGPTLTKQGLGQSEVLGNPVIELHQGAATLAINDDFGTAPNSPSLVSTGARIGATPIDAADSKSSTLLIGLAPGVYSFIASGKENSSGIALVEIYDAD